MAFEHYWHRLNGRVHEHRDPGSADVYLAVTGAAEALVKLAGISVLSEGAYVHGLDIAKSYISQLREGTGPASWSAVGEVAARFPPPPNSHAIQLTQAPRDAVAIHESLSAINDLLMTELGIPHVSLPKSSDKLRWRHVLPFLTHIRNKVKG